MSGHIGPPCRLRWVARLSRAMIDVVQSGYQDERTGLLWSLELDLTASGMLSGWLHVTNASEATIRLSHKPTVTPLGLDGRPPPVECTGDTWRNIRHELDRMHLVTLATPDGQVAQRSATTPGQKTILSALALPEPPKFFDFEPPR